MEENYYEIACKMAKAMLNYGSDYIICPECGAIIGEGYICYECGYDGDDNDYLTFDEWLDDKGLDV